MHKVAKYSDRLKLVGKDSRYSLYEYMPTICSPLAIHFEKMRTVRRFRFMYELLKGGYRVYYLADGETIVGHCVVTPGGRRLSVSTKNDIVLGPYFVSPEYRGKGYAKLLVRMTLQRCSYDYRYAFDWIHKGNISSIKTSESIGMKVVGHLDVVGKFRKLVLNDKGSYVIYKYAKQ